jgi:hypothetical protein
MQRSALGSDVFWRPRSEILDFSFFSVILFAKCWWVETSFAIFRVPRMYRQTGFCRFLGFLGLWKINNLPVFSAPWPFDSVPGHHLAYASKYRTKANAKYVEGFKQAIHKATTLELIPA